MPYLTPDFDGTAPIICRLVAVPSYFLPALNGALLELTFSENWEQFGDMTEDDCVQAMLEMFDRYTLDGSCMIGSIIPFIRDTLPANALPCDGSTHNKADYPLLYDVLPASLIVDANTFTTPDLTGVFLLGDGAGRTILDSGGEETHTLTVAEMPAHTHGYITASASVSTVVAPDQPAAIPSPATTDASGNGQAHNNMPPYSVVKYGIVAM